MDTHQTNGRRQSLDDLQEEISLLRARAELRELRIAEAVGGHVLESFYPGYTGTTWGDLVDPMDAFRDTALARPLGAGNRYDRMDGRNRPFVWTEIDLDAMRGQARWVATRNPLGVGAVECLADYTVRTGFQYEAHPGKHFVQDRVASILAHQVQDVLDDFCSLNTLGETDEQVVTWADREWAAVAQSVIDGEVFLRAFAQDDGTTLVRSVEPEQVRQPLGSPDEYTFGIKVDPRDVERKISYAISYSHPDDWEEVPGSQIAHLKLNTPVCVKRGLSDFYSTAEAIDEVGKLLKNMRVGGSLQAAIPWIEEYTDATPASVQAQVQRARDQNRPDYMHPITGRTINYQKYEPGTIPKIGAGRKYQPSPAAGNAGSHQMIVQACLRAVGTRWRMPEYMISGDAGGANYASTLVAGAPFVVRVECRQAVYGRFFLRVLWMAIRNAARAGRFIVDGRTYDWREVSRLVDVVPTPPQVAIANQAQESQIDHQDIQAGVMSIATRRARRGLDDEAEARNIAREKASQQQTRQPAAGTEQTPPVQSARQVLGEGIREGEGERKIGEVWKGESGRYFTKNQDGHVVPTAAPGGESQPRAKQGGEYGPNGEWYRAGAWIATTEMPKMQRRALEKVAKRNVEIEPGIRKEVPGGMISIYSTLGPGVTLDPRSMTLNANGVAYVGWSADEKRKAESLLELYLAGEREAPLGDYWELSNYSDLARAALSGYPIPGEALARMAGYRGETVEELKGRLALGPYQSKKKIVAESASILDSNLFEQLVRQHLNEIVEARGEPLTPDEERDLREGIASYLGALISKGFSWIKTKFGVGGGGKQTSPAGAADTERPGAADPRRSQIGAAASHPVWRYNNPDDDRSRKHHADRNGNYYPGNVTLDDVRGTDPAETMHCRCTITPVSRQEWESLRASGAQIADGYSDPLSEDTTTTGNLTEEAQRKIGEKWQGKSGKWFTKNQDGHVVPTAAPGGDGERPSVGSTGPSKPGARKDVKPPALAEKHVPPLPMASSKAPRNAQGKPTTGYAANGMTNTAFGDMVEAFASQLGMRSILPEGRRSNRSVELEGSSIDLEYDHSGYAFEVKAVCVEATEYKAKPKADEMEGKRKYAEIHGLKPAMMIVVVDTDKNEAHAYWRDGIGAYALNPKNLEAWNYAGKITLGKPQ